jgi:hypothetical protein
MALEVGAQEQEYLPILTDIVGCRIADSVNGYRGVVVSQWSRLETIRRAVP